MEFLLLRKYPILRVVPILFLFIGLWWLVSSSYFSANPETLSLAVTADLLIIIPLIYFLLIRGTRIPRITIVPVIIAGLLVGFLILPNTRHDYLILFRDFVLPFIELAVIAFIIYQVSQTVRVFKTQKNATTAFYSALRETLCQSLSGFAFEAVCMEIAVLYYGFFAWKKPSYRENEFTIHRESSGTALWILILFLVVVETFVFHLLLMQWSVVAAWIFSCISLYTGIQVLGIVKSISRRPITISPETLTLRYGIVNEIKIPLTRIQSLQVFTGDIQEASDISHLSLLTNLENHNMLLELKEPVPMNGLYGLKKEVSKLVLHVDDPERLLRIIYSTNWKG